MSLDREKERLDWHSGFDGGLNLSFMKYKKYIYIEREHPLSKEPLMIDFLVIKKNDNVVINNAVGEDFLKYNIIEYKNPNDELNIDVLYKVIAYACLYKSFGDSVDAIKDSEITISIFRTRKPKKLLKQLVLRGKTVKQKRPGVYNVIGIIDIPLNIIVMGELKDKELLAFNIMTHNADEEMVKLFLKETRKFKESGARHYADAVLQISAGANKELYRKLRGEQDMCEALKEIMADDLREAEAKGEEKGIEKGIDLRDKEKITEMLNLGRSPKEIADFCKYPMEQVMQVYNDLNK
jgi:hypothetical protein